MDQHAALSSGEASRHAISIANGKDGYARVSFRDELPGIADTLPGCDGSDERDPRSQRQDGPQVQFKLRFVIWRAQCTVQRDPDSGVVAL